MRLHLTPPALIRITDQGLKDYGDGVRQAGTASGPLATIHPAYATDAGLLAHELFHVWRWWLIGLLSSALIALAGWLAGSVEIAGVLVPLWSFAPAGLAANSLLYTHWPKWREAEEIDAYRVQARCYPVEQQPAKLAKFAGFIATRYGLDTSAAEVLQRLNGDWEKRRRDRQGC